MVSVIIVTHDCYGLFRNLMTVLPGQINPEDEIIVVANSPDNDTASFIRQLPAKGIKIIRNDKNKPFYQAVNQAAEIAKGDYLLLLNDDIIPITEGWLDKMVKCAQRHPWAAVIGCKLLYPKTDTIQHAGVDFSEIGIPYHLYHNSARHAQEVIEEKKFKAVTFACALLKKEFFEELEGLQGQGDEWSYHYEDVDYCLRAIRAGYEIWYTPEAELYHLCGTTSYKEQIKRNFASKQEAVLWIYQHVPDVLRRWGFLNHSRNLILKNEGDKLHFTVQSFSTKK